MKKKILVGLILAAGVIATFGWWISRPVTGTIIKRKNISEINKVVGWQNYQGKVFSFDYPPQLVVGSSEDGKVFMVGSGGISWQLTVVAKEYSGDLNEVADIKMRQVKKGLYEEFVIDDKKCFRKKDSVEKVCWWQKDGVVISMALTANSNDPELDNNYERMVRSVRINPLLSP